MDILYSITKTISALPTGENGKLRHKIYGSVVQIFNLFRFIYVVNLKKVTFPLPIQQVYQHQLAIHHFGLLNIKMMSVLQ